MANTNDVSTPYIKVPYFSSLIAQYIKPKQKNTGGHCSLIKKTNNKKEQINI